MVVLCVALKLIEKQLQDRKDITQYHAIHFQYCFDRKLLFKKDHKDQERCVLISC